MALALVSLVGVPALDSIVCAADGAHAASSASATLTDADETAPGADGCVLCPAGACANGQCQLPGAVLTAAPGLRLPPPAASAVWVATGRGAASHETGRLERPPRA